jgi:membrane protease YdiL (CAAX protease family)
MDVLALIIAMLLIFGLMYGSIPLSPRRYSPSRSYIRLYVRCIFNSLVLLGVIGVIALHDGIPLASLGLQFPTLWWPTLLTLVGAGLLFALILLIHLHALKNGPLVEKPRLALPRSSSERLAWVAVSLDAGIGEEIIFRGFLPWYLAHHLTFFGLAIPYVWTAIFSLILFGLAHLYQGWKGALFVGFIGITLALFYAFTGNLLVSMLWHFLFDVRFSFIRAVKIEDIVQRVDEVEEDRIEDTVQPVSETEENKLEVPLQPPQPPVRRKPQRAPGKTKKRQHTREKKGQPVKRLPYYARGLPPYPDARSGRQQRSDLL